MDTFMSTPEQTVLQIVGKVLGRPKANINLVSAWKALKTFVLFTLFPCRNMTQERWK